MIKSTLQYKSTVLTDYDRMLTMHLFFFLKKQYLNVRVNVITTKMNKDS